MRGNAILAIAALAALIITMSTALQSPAKAQSVGFPGPVDEPIEVDVGVARDGDMVTLTWDTDEPTSLEGYVQWSTETETTSSTFADDPAVQHSVELRAPDALAVGWGYVVSSGATFPVAPATFVIPPDPEAIGLPSDEDGSEGTGEGLDDLGPATVIDPGEPDSLYNPRRFTAGGPPVTGCFQDDNDTDYFSFTVPPTGHPIEVEFQGFPSQVFFRLYSPTQISMWFNGPLISASYAAPSGTYLFSMTNYGPGVTEQYRVTGYVLTGNPDPYEPNSFSQPSAWPTDSDMVVAYIQSNGDSDYYWVELEAGKTIYPSIPDSYLIGSVTISWYSGGRWYSRNLASGPFTAPLTARYTITVGPRPYGYGITASCAHVPYVIGLGGLHPPAPTISEPTQHSTVAPLQVAVKWIFTSPDGATQAGYRLQVATDPYFEHLVADETVSSIVAQHILDLPTCGEYFARVKVLTDGNEWSGWSEWVGFYAELAMIASYPESYCATELGQRKDAYFTIRALQPCSVEWGLYLPTGERVYGGDMETPAEDREANWPGVLVRTRTEAMPFGVVLAPPGRYVFKIQAVDPDHPEFCSFDLVEFEVTW